MNESEESEPSNAFLGLLTVGLIVFAMGTAITSLAGLSMLASPGGQNTFAYLAMSILLIIGPLAPITAIMAGWWLALAGRRQLAARAMIGVPLFWLALIMIVQIVFW